jgi:hypothetical protein
VQKSRTARWTDNTALRSNFGREAFSWAHAELTMKVVFAGQSGDHVKPPDEKSVCEAAVNNQQLQRRPLGEIAETSRRLRVFDNRDDQCINFEYPMERR